MKRYLNKAVQKKEAENYPPALCVCVCCVYVHVTNVITSYYRWNGNPFAGNVSSVHHCQRDYATMKSEQQKSVSRGWIVSWMRWKVGIHIRRKVRDLNREFVCECERERERWRQSRRVCAGFIFWANCVHRGIFLYMFCSFLSAPISIVTSGWYCSCLSQHSIDMWIGLFGLLLALADVYARRLCVTLV